MNAKLNRPKSANGNGGARLRANGTWEWRESLSDGRRFSGYGKTQSVAKAACVEKVRQAERGIDPKAAKQTLGRFLDWWLEDVVKPNRAPKTNRAYQSAVTLHIAPELGKIELGKLSAQHVTSLLRAKERAGLSPRSVAMIREILRNALNVAIKMQMIDRNAAALAPAPRQVKTEPHMFAPDQARRLLAVTDAHRLAALWRLAITLGMRQAEIIGLRWVDVDIDVGVLRVRQTLQRVDGEIYIKEPKTSRSRRTIRWHHRSLPPSAHTRTASLLR